MPHHTSPPTATAFALRRESTKPFAEVVGNLERRTAEHNFRVLHVHDVQATLAERGLARGPLKIIEVCNAGFAHQALGKDVNVALFMPCRFVVHTEGGTTVVTLARPSMIADLMPHAGLTELARGIEQTLTAVVEESL
ncbi:MAG: DUF302 domain-containing protein [candidate division Zixibacteria bacterium]|nr:DUF302 domain-containing protein [candidate division Zixibacteria bacterium]